MLPPVVGRCCHMIALERSGEPIFVGHFKGVGRVYLQAVVDTFGS